MKRVNPKPRRSAHFKTRSRRGSYLGVTGKYPSPHNRHCLFFEGFRERDLIVLLSFDDTVEGLEDHPFRIEYLVKGKARIYTPDLFVRFRKEAGRADLLVEVKLSSELRRTGKEYGARFRAARGYCRSRSMKFRVVTERSLPRPLVGNLRFLLPYRREPPEPALDEAFLDLAQRGVQPLRNYVQDLGKLGFDQGDVIFGAWRLAARQLLKVDLNAPLSMDTRMEAGAWTLTI
ncbi:MAG: TnsA endonuclease N-terminal domain-containing protein [Proteobacteria bacterium]|nr:TnsA endonuclease N-terminal domain-containing protein [Pseudomonadota bacterium]